LTKEIKQTSERQNISLGKHRPLETLAPLPVLISTAMSFPDVHLSLTKNRLFSAEAQLFFDKYCCSCYNATTFYYKERKK